MLTGEGVTSGDEGDHPPQEYMEEMMFCTPLVTMDVERLRRSPRLAEKRVSELEPTGEFSTNSKKIRLQLPACRTLILNNDGESPFH